MPFVNISLARGKSAPYLEAVSSAVHEALVQELGMNPGVSGASADRAGVLHAALENQPAATDVDSQFLAACDLAVQQHPGHRVVHLTLDGAAQRPGPEVRLISVVGDPVDRCLGEVDDNALRMQAAPGAL